MDESEVCNLWWEHLGVEVSILFDGLNYLIQSQHSGVQRMYESLLGAIESVEEFHSSSAGEMTVEIRRGYNYPNQEILNLFFSNPKSPPPSGTFADAQYSGNHAINLNGGIYKALMVDQINQKIVRIDQSTDLIEMKVLAQYSEVEYQSHGSGSAKWILARLPDQSIVWLCEEDEMDGCAIVKTERLSDLESVKTWRPSVEARGDCFLERLALAFFGDAETIRRGSEFNSDWSSSLEMSLTFNLSETDLEELWRTLVKGLE
jgi:hypothetical protein